MKATVNVKIEENIKSQLCVANQFDAELLIGRVIILIDRIVACFVAVDKKLRT